MRFAIVVSLFGLGAVACNPKTGGGIVVAQTAEQKANSSASAEALGRQSTVLQLAIPVEVSAAGVKVVGEAQVIRAPRPQPGAGPQLVVTLQGAAADASVLRQYELPDPRVAEIEGQGQTVLKRARTFVYVELNERASQVDVKPRLEAEARLAKRMEFGEAAKTSISLASVASKACAGSHASSPLCQEVLADK